MNRLSIVLSVLVAGVALAADWPHWGRDASHNMVTSDKGLPVDFEPGKPLSDGSGIDPATMKGVKWTARLGSAAYGNPTVAGGRVYVGVNNEFPRDAKHKGDRGIVLCLDEASGKMLWQLVVPKLAAGQVSDYENVGICSSPAVDDDRVYVVTSRCEVVCLDAKGMSNGNDGPFKEEAQYVAGPGKPPVEAGPGDADILWRFDMRDELGVFPHQMTSSSVLIVGDRLYAATSNGRDWTHHHIPAPDAPALICLDKKTGKPRGRERSGISKRTLNCNWSSPAHAKIGGMDQIIFGGGDGWCYGFEAAPETSSTATEDGIGTLKEVWRFDCNPEKHKVKNGKPIPYPSQNGPSEIVATPVAVNGRVYIAVGQNPELGDGVGCLSCIDATKTGDITQTGKLWQYDKIMRSLSTVSVADGLVYVADFAGILHCLSADTGAAVWTHDTEGKIMGSTLVGDGKVYIGNETGELSILSAGREKKLLRKAEFDGPVYSSPVFANGVLYVMTDKRLFAISGK